MARRPKSAECWRVDERTGCWLWQRATTSDGYGRVRFGGRLVLTHRLTFKVYRGPLPDDVPLDHVVCDTPGCGNPWHVEKSTNARNTRRGRTAKLTSEQARAVRARASAGEARKVLAAEFGVSVSEVGYIARGERWA